MKTISKTILWALLLIGAVAIAVPQQASALGTASGTSISNQATVNFQVGGVSQTPINSAPVTFVVDDKVMMIVTANDAAAVTTYPGSNAQAMRFTISNTGNTTHDFALTAASIAATTVVGATTVFYADTNGNGSYDPATDLALPVSGSAYIDELPVDASRVVFLVITVPINAASGQTANYSMTAGVHQGGGVGTLGALTKTQADADKLLGNDSGTVQIVLADASGDGDALYDGSYTRNGVLGFTISAATLTVAKISTVYSDPVNGTTLPKAIPGAIVTYTVTVTNTAGTVAATNVSISDSLNAEITAVPPRLAFATQFTGNLPACVAGQGIIVDGVCKTNASAVDDGVDWSVTGANTVTVTGLSLAVGASAIIKFQVAIL